MNDDSDCRELTFEQALARVEQIVRKLEEGQLGLTEALSEYESGVKHLRHCYGALEQAERKIEFLSGVDSAGKPISRPFDDAELTLEEKAESRSRRRSSKGAKAPPAPPAAPEVVDDPPGLF